MKKLSKGIKNYFFSIKEKDKNKEVFAFGVSFSKLFLIFVIVSIIGAYYEEILNLVKIYFQTGTIIYQYRRGVLYGPFSPVYGMGAVVMLVILLPKKRTKGETFLLGSLLGGAFEYLISFLQELVTNTTSWNYSSQFLNINGRTTIPIMIAWGIAVMLLVHYLYPYLSKQIEKIPYLVGSYLVLFLGIFLTLDCLLSWTALFRSTLRRERIEPITKIGEVYDKVYPDFILQKHFPNMDFKRGE